MMCHMDSLIDTVIIGGGQSGLAAARAFTGAGLRPVLLEAGPSPTGSWPHYYDSLTLFSPARYSALPGLRFPGDPDRYPHRDEVADYLTRYASLLDADIRPRHTVTEVSPVQDGFAVRTSDGLTLHARSVVAASGSFSNPYRPALPGLDTFTGTVLHSAAYRSPEPFAGRRVIVVGAGNTALQVAVELAAHAHVSLATRAPISYARQRPLGRDLHFWLTVSGLDRLPIGPLIRRKPGVPVLDTGRYRAAVRRGAPGHRPMWSGIDGDRLIWADGTQERFDTILLATGYRPALPYLKNLDLTQRRGISVAHPGLAFLGLEWQRTLASNTLRGVGADARHIAGRLSSELVPSRRTVS
jgi:putative flavoprotein involved in K+ transport